MGEALRDQAGVAPRARPRTPVARHSDLTHSVNDSRGFVLKRVTPRSL